MTLALSGAKPPGRALSRRLPWRNLGASGAGGGGGGTALVADDAEELLGWLSSAAPSAGTATASLGPEVAREVGEAELDVLLPLADVRERGMPKVGEERWDANPSLVQLA